MIVYNVPPNVCRKNKKPIIILIKELIPEFYMRDGNFLTNFRGLDLEIEINGYKHENVILPKWANVYIFILINLIE